MSLQRRSKLAIALALACCVVAAPQAIADLTLAAVNNPIDANSWYQAFELKTDRPFEYVGLYLTPLRGDNGSGFGGDAWDLQTLGNPHDFSQLSVGNNLFGPSWTTAGGDATTNMLWQSHFTGERVEQRFHLTLFTFNDESDWQGATAVWDGNAWKFGVHTPDTAWQEFAESGGVPASIVPGPPAVLLGLIGFGLVGAIRRRLL
jgi:hypothetical protein